MARLRIICILLMVIAEFEDKHRNDMRMVLLFVFGALFRKPPSRRPGSDAGKENPL